MTTDYVTSLGDPEPYLRRIAEAGFTHVHWCHEWNTEYFYPPDEMKKFGKLLEAFDLELLDLHAPHGLGWGWGSPDEAERRRAVELLRNRIDLTSELSGGALVLHLPEKPGAPFDADKLLDALCRTLDEIEPATRGSGIAIALENLEFDSFEGISRLFSEYDPDFLGLCYDSGHGNIFGGDFAEIDGYPGARNPFYRNFDPGGESGLDHLERCKDRLVSVHIHDNDGRSDRHDLPFSGTVDWPRLARILAASSYRGCVSLESNMRGLDIDEGLFLDQAHRAASELTRMIETARSG